MHIRRATADDMDFLWEMLYLSVFVPVGSPPLSKKEVLDAPDINLYLTNWGRSGDVAFIVEENAELFGAAWMRMFTNHEHGYGYVDDRTPEIIMAVLSSHRNQGIGSSLMSSILKYATDQKYRQVSLSVDPANKALNLYERFGFAKIGECDTSWTMLKTLYDCM